MKKHISRIIAAMLALALISGVSGCSIRSPDELYSLPRLSNENLQLQNLLAEEIASGSEYSAPASGSYRQSVQMYDIDNDGVNEALAFFKSSDQMPKICVYRQEQGKYVLAATVLGDGGFIGSVEYAEMDPESGAELIVTWQNNSGMKILNVYSMKNYSMSVLLTTDCTAFHVADLDSDGLQELLCIKADTLVANSQTGEVTLYKLSHDGEMTFSSAALSPGITSVSRVRSTSLSDGIPAVFVESLWGEGGTVTDVFVLRGSDIKNISPDPHSGESRTVRSYVVYAQDIDGNKTLNIPSAKLLPKARDSSTAYWVYDWYDLDINGRMSKVMSTYHCASDGWYLVLNDALRQNLTVRRVDSGSGERTVVLSSIDPGTQKVTDLLTIYTLTGENRRDRANTGERFVLHEEDATIYAALINSEELSMTQTDVIAAFNLIYAEWNTGAL